MHNLSVKEDWQGSLDSRRHKKCSIIGRINANEIDQQPAGAPFDMTNHNRTIGQWGEQAAVNYLTARGYEIITRNARTPYGEIDIIAKQGDIHIFIEVKSRTSLKMGLPEESV